MRSANSPARQRPAPSARLPADRRVLESDARSVRQRPLGGGDGGGQRRGDGFCPRRAGEPAARHRARLCRRAQGAAEAHVRSALDRLGRGLRRQQHHERRSGGRLEQCHHQHLSALPAAWIITIRPTRSSALRWPAAAPIGASLAGSAPDGATPSRPASTASRASGPAYLAAALAFSQSLDDDQPLRAWAISSPRTSTGRATAGGSRPVIATPCCRRFGVTPYAALQAQDFHTPSYSETDLTGGGFGLSYTAMNATDIAQRTRRALRRSDRCSAAMPLILRAPRCLGARLCQQSGAQRGVRNAAGHELRRQRRADPAELGADLGGRRTVHHLATGPCSPSSTASSPPARRPTPAAARCGTRGNFGLPARMVRLADFRSVPRMTI